MNLRDQDPQTYQPLVGKVCQPLQQPPAFAREARSPQNKRKSPQGRGGWLRRSVVSYLIFAGIVGNVIMVGVLYKKGINPVVIVNKVWHRARDYATEYANTSPEPSMVTVAHVFDGVLRDAHPRILMPELAPWKGKGRADVMAARYARWDPAQLRRYDPCKGGGMVGMVSCWVTTGDENKGDELIAAINAFKIKAPTHAGDGGNAWQLAFGYDFARLSPYFSLADQQRAEQKLELVLVKFLAALDDQGASLWHGRSSLAAEAWLVASVLDADTPEHQELQRRVQGHFLDVMKALSLVEAWPEGYNYWINSRALTMVLAMSSYVNALTDSSHHDEVIKVLNRVGLWHVYATRPDHRMAALGDEGPRVDLKDETHRIIDLIAQVTRNPVFASYGDYVSKLHGRQSYYRSYQATYALFNDPTVAGVVGVKKGELAGLKASLPAMEVFGRDAMNLAVIRSGWSANDTFISFRAGASFVHHGHYDAGHFTLFKGKPLASNSGTYGGYTQGHRLNYYIRTVAKNALLIMRPGEQVRPNRFFQDNVSDGGQRVVIPTGSWITSVADFGNNLGKGMHYEAGKLIGADHVPGRYAYLSADLTAAYNSDEFDETGGEGKVSEVTREMLYLFAEDRLIVHDKVVSSQAAFTKKWLLHTIPKPKIDGLAVLRGSERAGIMQSVAASAVVEQKGGSLRVDRVYPADGVMRLVGGPGYRYYVETDGDDTDFDGVNQTAGVKPRAWFDAASWRIEIQPGSPRKVDHFLVGLTPTLDDTARAIKPMKPYVVQAKDVHALKTERSLVVFVGKGTEHSVRLLVPEQQSVLYVAGLTPSSLVSVDQGLGKKALLVDAAGLAEINLTVKPGEAVTIDWL